MCIRDSFKDSLDEQTAKRMLNQYILSQLKPIKPDELNATFRKILSDHDITGKQDNDTGSNHLAITEFIGQDTSCLLYTSRCV